MPEKFTVEIISPDRTLLKSETSEVIIPSYEGEMGILKEHIPLITFLRPGIIKIRGNEEKSFFVEEGTVEFVNNSLLILTSTAKELTDIDQNYIKNSIIKVPSSTIAMLRSVEFFVVEQDFCGNRHIPTELIDIFERYLSQKLTFESLSTIGNLEHSESRVSSTLILHHVYPCPPITDPGLTTQNMFIAVTTAKRKAISMY